MTYGGTLFAAYYNQHRSRLPAGYREVEYIESTGEQWIDTGYTPNSRSFSTVDYALTSLDTGIITAVYGAFKSSANNANRMYLVKYSDNRWLPGVGNWSDYAMGTADLSRHRFSVSFASKGYGFDGVCSYPAVGALTPISNFPLVLFAMNTNNGISRNSSMLFYSFNAGDDDGDARKLVPCVRLADSKPGMYDLCGSICPLTNSPFYINSGSGADFTWGELS